jgi:hypothetical protein
MRGLDPRIHHSSQDSFEKGWIAGSSPAMTELQKAGSNPGLFVIASQRVGAKRRPMTGSAKQSRATNTDWIASSQVLLAMTNAYCAACNESPSAG